MPQPPQLIVEGHSNAVTSVALSADGNRLVSGSYDGTVILWNVNTGAMERLFAARDTVHCVLFSQEGGIYCNDGQVWESLTGKRLRRSRRTNAPLALSPNGHLLANAAFNPEGDGWIVRLTSARTGRTKQILVCQEYPESLAFSSDGRLIGMAGNAAEGVPCALSIFNLETGEMHRTLQDHDVVVYGVGLPPHTRLTYIDWDAGQIWDAETGSLLLTVPTSELLERWASVDETALSPDGTCLAVGYSTGLVAMYSLPTSSLLWQAHEHQGWIRTLAFTADSRTLASAGNDHAICLWDTQTGALRRRLPGRTGEVWRLAFSKDAPVLAAEGNDRHIRLWNLQTGALQATQEAFIDDLGRVIPISDDAWQFEERQQRERRIVIVGEGENTLTATLSSPGTITIVQGSWRREIQASIDQWERVISFALSPDGRMLVTGQTTNGIGLWDVRTGKRMRWLGGGDDPLALVFSPDGKTLAIGTAYDEAVTLAALRRGGKRGRLIGHSNSIRSLAYSPDGRWLASGAADNTVKLWDAKCLKLILTLYALPEGEWLACTPEGFYHCSPGTARFMGWHVGTDVLPAKSFAAEFFQPDRVQDALNASVNE